MPSPSLRVEYKRVDDCVIHTDIYVPGSAPSGISSYPTLINIHGGAFMLGHSGMVNQDQISDCLARGWIVLAPNHRLCPQVSIQDGPLADLRSLLAWIHEGGLDAALSRSEATKAFQADKEKVVAFGTSSGGALALGLGFGVPTPVAGILDFYGPCAFDDPFWGQPLSHMKAPNVSPDFIQQVWTEAPVPTEGGKSLEGHAGPPDHTKNPRVGYALTQIANGTVMKVNMPSGHADVDACLNVSKNWPPTCIVHGNLDDMVPMHLSKKLSAELERAGVRHEFIEVEGEKHTFAGQMKSGTKTWETQRRGFDFLESIVGKGPGV